MESCSCSPSPLPIQVRRYPVDSRSRVDGRSLHELSHTPLLAPTYKSAITSMQESLILAPTLEIQHRRLIAMRDDFQKLPLDSASHQIHTGQLKEAIETLERGRGLLWSEMRGLRTSIDHLRTVNSCLAEKFRCQPRPRGVDNIMFSNFLAERRRCRWQRGDRPFDRIVAKQRKLLDKRASLISQIQSLPGFENFLMAPSINTLRSAAACGPVIIVNHSE